MDSTVEAKERPSIPIKTMVDDVVPAKKENAQLSRDISKLVRERQYEKARILLLNYIEGHPKTEWARHQLSLIYYQMGRIEEAISLLEELHERDKDNVDYLMGLGSLVYDNADNSNPEKAVYYLRKVLEKRPNDHHAWRNLGVTLYHMDDIDEAFDCLFKSAHLNPEDFVTHNSLCMYLEQQGRNQEARAHGALALLEKDKLATKTFNVWQDRLNLNLHNDGILSDDRSHRHKNVLSFSLWGDNPSYVDGAIINARDYHSHLPGWTLRFYHDDTVPERKLEDLRRLGAETFKVSDDVARLAGGMWRFMVANDETVDYFCCRDADCRPSKREALMVRKWQMSGKNFHIIRDDIWHCDLMLAGLWGGRAGLLPDILIMGQATYNNSIRKWDDQEFLRDYIWPLIKDQAIVHDNNYRVLGGEAPPIMREIGVKDHVGYGYRMGAPKSEVKQMSVNIKEEDPQEIIRNVINEQFAKDTNTSEIKIVFGQQEITAYRDIITNAISLRARNLNE